MIMLYPSAIQFHCGVIAGAAFLAAGMALWAGEWVNAGAAGTVGTVAVIASSFLATREDRWARR